MAKPRLHRRNARRWLWRGLAGALLGILLVAAYSTWRVFFAPPDSTPAGTGSASATWRVPAIPRGEKRLLLVMIDGLSVPAYEQALASGRLPHLQRLMHDRPTAVAQAVSTFPSATSPSVQELLSGYYAELEVLTTPGAVHAFDREERRVIRYVTEPDSWRWPLPTLFDAVRGQPAVTVFEGRWDGPTAILTQLNLAGQAALAALGATALSDGDAGPVRAYLQLLNGPEPPVVSLVVLNEFDMAAHFFGPHSDEALAALQAMDALFGEIVATLNSRPGIGGRSLLDDTVILVFGDHGMVETGRFVDLPKFLAGLGVDAVDVSTVPHVLFRERLGTLWTQWPDAILVAGGSNVTQVYLRRASGAWSDTALATDGEARRAARGSPAPDTGRQMASLEGIAQVMRIDEAGVIHVVARDSEARIVERLRGTQRVFAYVVPADAVRDPFGYLAQEATRGLVCRGETALESCFMDSRSWSDLTYTSRFPSAVPLVPKAFRPAKFAGDYIVTAEAGYSFLRGQEADHGNLDRDAVLTPLILNGPGIHPCDEAHVPRLVDIFPTASVLLGADPADPAFAGMDGRVLDCVQETAQPAGDD